MSERKRTRDRESEDRREHKKHKTSKNDLEKLKTQTKKLNQEVQKLKHIETFYEKPPPGFIKEHEEKPEDCIPADPGNEDARNFLANAPTKGLWMPLGKEVKVMQCWRCKRYGHRTGDKECPFFIKGNQKLEQFRVVSLTPIDTALPRRRRRLRTIIARRRKKGRTRRRRRRKRRKGSESTNRPKPTTPIQTEANVGRAKCGTWM
uniref:RP9 pre-mRNA splicing factor n=1 Tax=Poecilia mexicana TaxID=48701 RepID=A0A3B3XUI8_9TELE